MNDFSTVPNMIVTIISFLGAIAELSIVILLFSYLKQYNEKLESLNRKLLKLITIVAKTEDQKKNLQKNLLNDLEELENDEERASSAKSYIICILFALVLVIGFYALIIFLK